MLMCQRLEHRDRAAVFPHLHFWVCAVLSLTWTTSITFFLLLLPPPPTPSLFSQRGKAVLGAGSRTKKLKGWVSLEGKTNLINFLPLLKLAVLTGPSAAILAKSWRSLFSKLWLSLLGNENDDAYLARMLKEFNDSMSAQSPACSKHAINGSGFCCLLPRRVTRTASCALLLPSL